MSDENIRLVMEAVDKFSPAMKQFVTNLKGITAAGKEAHDKGAKQATEHGIAYKKLAEQMSALKTKGTDIARPALAEMGIAVTGVAGAVAAMGAVLVKSTKDWSEWGQTLTFARRASGLHVDTLRALSEANVEYGGTQEDTVRSLEEFGQHMDQQARRSYAWLNAYKQFPTLWNSLGKSLNGLNREDQLKRVMDFIPTIKDSDQRARVLAFYGLPANWRDMTSKEMADMERKGAEWAKTFGMNAERAQKFHQMVSGITSTLRGITEVAGGWTGGKILDGVELVANSKTLAAIKEDVEVIGKDFAFVGEGAKAIGGFIKQWDLAVFRVQADTIRSAFDGIRAAAEFIKNLSAPSKPHTDDNTWLPWGKPVFGDDKKTQESVKKGVTEGLQDFYHSLKDANGSYTPMAYHTEASSAHGGSFGSSQYPALSDDQAKAIGGGGQVPKSMGRAPDGSNAPDIGGSSGSLADQRKKFSQELQSKPWLKEKIFQLSAGEDRPSKGPSLLANQAVMETMMNRATVRGTSLEKQAQWYDRARKTGYYAGHPSVLSEHERKMSEANLAAVLGGSNVSDYATDNSSQGLAAKEKRTGSFLFRKEYHGESFFAPGTAEKGLASRWSQWHTQMLAQDHGAKLRDMARRGSRPSDASMLKRGMRATDASDSLSGSAHLTVDLNGFPKGTRTGMKADGVFKQVTLNRGRPMAPASETS